MQDVLADPNRLNQLGLQALSAAKYKTSEMIFSHALRLVPGQPVLLNNLGLTYRALGRLASAWTAFQQAIQADPNYDIAYQNCGELSLMRGEFDEARRLFEAGRTLNPTNASATFGLASVLEAQKRPLQALTLLEESQDHLSAEPDYWWMLADLQAGLKRDTAAEASLQEGIRRHPASSACHLKLGRWLEKKGDFAQALAAYHAGNRFRQPEASHRETTEAELLSQERLWSKHSHPPFPNLIEPMSPVFVVGVTRSGTTLVDRLLNAHPSFQSEGERNLVPTVFQAGLSYLGEGASTDDLLKAIWLERNHGLVKHLQITLTECLNELGSVRNGRICIDKLPQNRWALGIIAAAAPNARVIYALRDGIEVVWSNYTTHFALPPWYAPSLADGAFFWNASKRVVQAARRALPLAVYEVRYERLIEDFDGVTQELFSFLEVPWLDVRGFAQASDVVRTASSPQLRKGLVTTSLHRTRSFPEIQAEIGAHINGVQIGRLSS